MVYVKNCDMVKLNKGEVVTAHVFSPDNKNYTYISAMKLNAATNNPKIDEYTYRVTLN